MPIKVDENTGFRKVKSARQTCSHCGELMKKGEVALSIRKEVKNGYNYNIWIHIDCVEDFCEKLMDSLEKNMYKIRVEGL